MSFLHPFRLVLLLGVVGLAAAYVVVHLRRRRAIARYTNPALHHLVAPDRLGWKRHAAPALSLASLALLLVGIAQPTRAEKIPRDGGVVVLAVDVSASMQATDIAPTRIDAAKAGAKNFVADMPPGMELGLVAFDGGARLLVEPTTDHGSVVKAIDSLVPGPGTAAGEGVYTSLDAIKTSVGAERLAAAKAKREKPATIVLLSDGVTTLGRPVEAAARAATDAGVPVSTIAYGTPTGTVTVDGVTVDVPADSASMSTLAEDTGGRFFEAASAGQLEDVYSTIRADAGYRVERRDVSRGLLGLAMVVMVGSLGLAMALAGRPM